MKRFAVALALVMAFGGAQAQQKIVLRAADNQPADYPTVKGLKFMAEYLKTRTSGRITMQVFPGGQLGDERTTIEQTQLGVIDIVRTSTSPVGEFYKPMGVYSLPYLFRDPTHFWKVLLGPVGEELLSGMESSGLRGLAYYDSGARHFYTTKKPIRTPDDLKGMKIRTQQSQVVIDMMAALGASPVPMAFAEVYSSLQTGVIDGAENNWPSYGPKGVRHYEVAKYFTLDGHARVPEVVMVSKRTWDKLSPADQAVLKDAAMKSVAVQRNAWTTLERESQDAVVKAGAQVVRVNTKLFQDKMQPVYTKYQSQFGTYIQRILDTK